VNAVEAFLDASHGAWADSVASWARNHLPAVPASHDDAVARAEAPGLAARMGDAGLLAPIATGSLRSLCLVREAVAGVSPLADAVVALQALAATPILLAGTDRQKHDWITPLVSGRAVGAFVMTEPEAGSDVAAMRTTARHDGDGWVLDGEKHLISNAGIADLHVVFAATAPAQGSRGITAFLVPAGTPGLVFDRAQVMAAPHPLGRIVLNGCRVPADAVLGEVDGGFKLGMMTLDRIRPSVGAAACGMAAVALADAVSHVRVRRQFGRPLGDLQLVRARLGEMATDLDAARLLVYRAAWEKDRGADRITVAAAMAKSFATEAAQRIVDAAVQLTGGLGVLVGTRVEYLYRAVRALRIYEGATDVQRLVIGAALLADPAPPSSPVQT
jgi:acyl-CoA dehydrogenase